MSISLSLKLLTSNTVSFLWKVAQKLGVVNAEHIKILSKHFKRSTTTFKLMLQTLPDLGKMALRSSVTKKKEIK